jgi:phosphatidylinositol alpha-mannosyltransferase
MTIGLLLDDTLDSSDGVQQAVLAIGKELTVRGHEVHYIVPTTIRSDIKNIHSIGKVVRFKFNGNSVRTPLPVSRKQIKQLFDSIDFDVLHVQMPYSPFLSAKILKYAPQNVKKVGTFHILPYSFISAFGTKFLGFFMRKSIRSIDTMIAVSEPSKDFMESTFKVVGRVIPNPVDYKFFSSFKRQKISKKSIVFVGRFEERKGVLELVEAYSKLPKTVRSDAKLTMCGKGPLLENVKSKALKLNLDIDFPGFVSDKQKAQFLANADIAVFPSKSGESFGIVLTEAMSARAGVVIGGNNPGYTSVLSEWPETLFDPSNREIFYSRLEMFLSDATLRASIGKEQHKEAKKYDIQVIVDQLEGIYNT